MSTSGGGIGGGLSDVRIRDFTGSALAAWIGYVDGSPPSINHMVAAARLHAYNGGTVDRVRTLSAVNLGAQSGLGGLIAGGPGAWAQASVPVAGNQATSTRAAAGVGIRHVCTGLVVAASAAAAPVATTALFTLRDGLSGAGSVLLQWTVFVPAAAGQPVAPVVFPIPDVVGSANTAMTAEWNAGVGNVQQAIGLIGYDAS